MLSGGKRDRPHSSAGGGNGHQEVVEVRVARRVYVGNLAWRTSWQVGRAQ